jgi:hypothetical protein
MLLRSKLFACPLPCVAVRCYALMCADVQTRYAKDDK